MFASCRGERGTRAVARPGDEFAGGGNWYGNDFTYTTNVSLGFTNPTPGSALSTPTVAFSWNAVPAADDYARQ